MRTLLIIVLVAIAVIVIYKRKQIEQQHLEESKLRPGDRQYDELSAVVAKGMGLRQSEQHWQTLYANMSYTDLRKHAEKNNIIPRKPFFSLK
jgi:hypothetical protein